MEVADVFRQGQESFLARFGHMLSRDQWNVLRAVVRCRTAALGGHVQQCNQCGHHRIQYNSCRNRHCPKCQAMARAAWLEQRQSELLPVPYFHLVFTVPHALAPLALQNKRVVYGLLFRAAAETLLQVAADPKHLGAKIGCLMVLHTWGQNLMHHPHVHCVVPGGGLAADHSRWISCQRSSRRQLFFLPVKILSAVFRGKFVHLLKQAFQHGQLHFHGQLKSLEEPATFEDQLNTAVQKDWVVYAKRPFGGPSQMLKYLARYSHRVAISNQRLVQLSDDRVSFRYKDYADGQRCKVMALTTTEFMRRFLMHTLPTGFVRIRYFGFLANRCRNASLDRCRELLGADSLPPPSPETNKTAESTDTISPSEVCPHCKHGKLVIIDTLVATGLPRPHFCIIREPSPRPPPTNHAFLSV